jgi:hypothetical protein
VGSLREKRSADRFLVISCKTGRNLPVLANVTAAPPRGRWKSRARPPRRLTAGAARERVWYRPCCAPDHEEDAVTFRTSSVLAATVGLWLAHTATAGPPAPQGREPGRLGVQAAASVDQEMADRIAAQLRQSGRLHGYRIEVSVENGVVELSGRVADRAQRDAALSIAESVPGVANVRDHLTVGAAAPVTPVTAVSQPLQEPAPLMGKNIAPPGQGVMVPEPTPIFSAPPGLPYASLNPPPLPPYAWPTFAPYNNYSRVAYPTVLPYQAWPYIGPMYPFPKVPLGWRNVQLTYYNGSWWYGKRATGHDWWRIRYWREPRIRAGSVSDGLFKSTVADAAGSSACSAECSHRPEVVYPIRRQGMTAVLCPARLAQHVDAARVGGERGQDQPVRRRQVAGGAQAAAPAHAGVEVTMHHRPGGQVIVTVDDPPMPKHHALRPQR